MSSKKNKKKVERAGVIAFGVTFVLVSSIFKIRGLIGLGIELALSAFVSSIVRTMAEGLDLTTKDQKKKQAEEAQVQAEAQRQQDEERLRQEQLRQSDPLEKIKGSTGVPDADALLTKGREMIREIREENDKIPDESLSAKLDTLENLCTEIFRAVYEKPAKASQIRKFMDYYLPTTLKMVKSYRMLGERSVTAGSAAEARSRIENALGIVTTGCRKMLNNLYQDDMLDITTDIDVLEQMLKRDGLTENDLQMAAQQAKQAARIDAAEQAARAQRQRTAAAQAAMPSLHTASGVKQAIDDVQSVAAQHMPQVPTISGEMFPNYNEQAGATAQAKQK